MDTATAQRCESCGEGVGTREFPQCVSCLAQRVPPAEIVPLAAPTPEGIRLKRVQWLQRHPGWSLKAMGEYLLTAAPTQSTPMGKKLYVAEYQVVRGSAGIV